MKFISVLSTAYLLSTVVAFGAEPFGIEKGAAVSSLKVESSEDQSPFLLSDVPKPHPLFDVYAVHASKRSGVCGVVAVSSRFSNDKYGSAARNTFERIKGSLTDKYGVPEDVNFLKTGALWDEPQDWVRSLQQNERIHASIWSGFAENENLKSLEVSIEGLSGDEAMLKMFYRFDNFDECQDELQTEQDDVF